MHNLPWPTANSYREWREQLVMESLENRNMRLGTAVRDLFQMLGSKQGMPPIDARDARRKSWLLGIGGLALLLPAACLGLVLLYAVQPWEADAVESAGASDGAPHCVTSAHLVS